MNDIVIIGGGPAGLCAAIMAAQAGRSVTICEPKTGDIDKACGEGLMPGAIRALEQLGVKPSMMHPFRGIRYIAQGRAAQGCFQDGTGAGVRRTVLHEALHRRASDLGVQWIQHRAKNITQHGSHASVDGIEARWVLAADGLHSPVRKHLGLNLKHNGRARLGIRRHFAMKPWSDFVEVYWTKGAEAYVTPVGPNLVGVAFLFDPDFGSRTGSSDPRSRYTRLLDAFPELKHRLESPCTAVRGAGPFEQRVRSRVHGRVLLIGDAAGYLDPITGEGIRLGIASAHAAIQCIADEAPNRYEQDWARLYRRYWWMTKGLLVLRRTPLRTLMVPTLNTVPPLMGAILGLLAEETLPFHALRSASTPKRIPTQAASMTPNSAIK